MQKSHSGALNPSYFTYCTAQDFAHSGLASLTGSLLQGLTTSVEEHISSIYRPDCPLISLGSLLKYHILRPSLTTTSPSTLHSPLLCFLFLHNAYYYVTFSDTLFVYAYCLSPPTNVYFWS